MGSLYTVRTGRAERRQWSDFGDATGQAELRKGGVNTTH